MYQKGENYFPLYKKNSIQIAKDLRYGQETINKIEIAETEEEIQRAMISARQGLKPL